MNIYLSEVTSYSYVSGFFGELIGVFKQIPKSGVQHVPKPKRQIFRETTAASLKAKTDSCGRKMHL